MQRTDLGDQFRRRRVVRTKEKELRLRRGESGKGAGVFRPFHRSKGLKSEVADKPGSKADQQDNNHHCSELHYRLVARRLAQRHVGRGAATANATLFEEAVVVALQEE